MNELAQIKAMHKWQLVLYGLLVVFLAILIITIFKNKSQTNEAYEIQIRSLDSTLTYQQKTIESLQKFNAQQDSVIKNLDDALSKNRPIETRIIHSYDKIPGDVNSLDREQLRREVSAY